MIITRFFVFMLAVLFLLTPGSVLAADSVLFSCQIPYYLGKPRSSIMPGERIQALFFVENRGGKSGPCQVSLELPAGWKPVSYDQWLATEQGGRYKLERSVDFAGGYGQWFDLVVLQAPADLAPGTYQVKVGCGETTKTVSLLAVAGGTEAQSGDIKLDKVILPLDRNGKRDERLAQDTLVLRDRQWDYYKNLLTGKGASNQEVEAIHPITHIGLDLSNPLREQRLSVITIELLDGRTHQPVKGLFTPGATGEDLNAGSLGGHQDTLVAFAALNGEQQQRILLPVYTDERLIAGGNYYLRIQLDDGVEAPIIQEAPLTIVKKDDTAALVVGGAMIVIIAGMLWSARFIRSILASMKTRWLVTVSLFGACAFAVVTVPATLLSDFFHILLGPFGFLVSGLFSSVFLYMIVAALVVLIPRPGIVGMMTLVRMLLGVLAFGQISPITLLSYGMHAFLLEAFLIKGGVYRQLRRDDRQNSRRIIVITAFLCGVADSIASYVGIQAMAFLYRYYYAGWYIWLLLTVNGFFYTAIGATCGILLGRRLSEIGGD